MRIVVAPDSFKESLPAIEAARAIAAGIRRAAPRASIDLVPMADGGEGTVEALAASLGGRIVRVAVAGPLPGQRVRAAFALARGRATAVLEMAKASGLALVPPARRNPLRTTTLGTGELLRAALGRGARRLILGIGGSATVDGGIGMAQALGVRFLDARGRPVEPTGAGLGRIAAIDPAGLDPRVRACRITVACDVTNPLYGPRGAAPVFGPQKGATPAAVRRLDGDLRRLAGVIRRDLGVDVSRLRGGGAAGGLGAGLVAFLGATLKPGIGIVIEATGLRDRLRGADLLVTGEGSFDIQSAYGKVVSGVARAARAAGVPLVVLAGRLGDRFGRALPPRAAAMTLVPGPCSLADAFGNAAGWLASAAEQAARLFLLGRRGR